MPDFGGIVRGTNHGNGLGLKQEFDVWIVHSHRIPHRQESKADLTFLNIF